MKKLTPSYKKWLTIRRLSKFRTLNRKKRKYSESVDAWYQGEKIKLVSTKAPLGLPSSFSFRENFYETIVFFNSWRQKMRVYKTSSSGFGSAWIKSPRKTNGLGRIEGYYDFSKINHISTAAAVVMAAEYDRAAQLLGKSPPLINLQDWNNSVATKFVEIGIFDILGFTTQSLAKYYIDGPVKTMKIRSGTNAKQLQQVGEDIEELCNFINANFASSELQEYLNGSVGEAIINVARHAYPSDHDFKHEPVNKWWVTASANKENKNLTVVAYDQGASIPITFAKRKDLHNVLLDWFRKVVVNEPKFEFENDAHYIEAAMKYGNTSTGKKERGKGIPQMKDMVDNAGGGSLRIMSRGGVCVYEYGKEINNIATPYSIGGTLIEWVINLPLKD